MVESRDIEGKTVHMCEVCGFGYSDRATAEDCEAFCTANNSCSLEITRKAIFKPD